MENLERNLILWFPLLKLHLFGNALSHWSVFFITGALLSIMCLMARTWALIRLERRHTKNPIGWAKDISKLVQMTGWPFLVATALLVASNSLEIKGRFYLFGKVLYSIIFFIQVTIWTNTLVSAIIGPCLKGESDEGRVGPKQTIIGFLVKGIVFSTVALVLLDNLNVNVSALVAGLGVGGVAVALAIRNILGDLFSSLSILLDKPFSVGDSLALGDYQGTVEKVGLKTTRIRSVTGELIVVPNSDILQSRVRNYKTVQKRRGVLKFTIGFDTSAEDLRRISDNIASVVDGIHKTTLSRAHFTAISQNGYEFEVIYHVETTEYNEFMDACQMVNLRTVELVEHLGLRMGPLPASNVEDPNLLALSTSSTKTSTNPRSLPQEVSSTTP